MHTVPTKGTLRGLGTGTEAGALSLCGCDGIACEREQGPEEEQGIHSQGLLMGQGEETEGRSSNR